MARFVCSCTDCQAFARFPERVDVLDSAGGTDIFQMPSVRMELTAGADAMRCLSPSNKVLRWFTDCCQSPIANTATGPRFPLVGVIHSFMDHEANHRSRNEAFGPPLCRSTNTPPSTAPTERARPAVACRFRPSRVNDARLVGALRTPAFAYLRTSAAAKLQTSRQVGAADPAAHCQAS
jgi:Family of unknown function (DUF6151)